MARLATENESAFLVLEIVPRTMRTIRSELRSVAKSELSVPQFRILAHLRQGSLNNRQLAELQGVSFAAMSRMVDGLVSRGLLQRVDNPEDRRQVDVTLTDTGREILQRLRGAVEKSIASRISALGPKPKKSLINGLEVLKELFP